MKFYYGVNPAEKREKLICSKAVKPLIDSIIAAADKVIGQEHSAFKMSEYMLFFKTGNRDIYEDKYFLRRRNCNHLMFAYWLTQDEKYLVPLIDYIMYICDEFSWCVPAHSRYSEKCAKFVVENVDLFQSETARFFAEIKMCVGDKLPPYVIERMTYEIRRRVFPTILDETVEKYWWESCDTNWATVCGSGCTMAALCFGTEEEQQKIVERFKSCLDNYLTGISDDGCCLEGMGYWGYGFEHFAILAKAIEVYTDGEIDYFKNPKVKKLAFFPQKIRMTESKVATFSDSDEGFSVKIGLISFLRSVYGDVLRPDLRFCTIYGNVDSACELLWLDENYKCDDFISETTFFPEAQWYIGCRDKYSFAAKGGHNSELHNHNDVGSFMITAGDEIFISDLGRGEYTKENFAPETRYTLLQNSSRGHSVPVINGEYQPDGIQYSSKNVKATDDTFELDFEGAYNTGAIAGINRRFSLEDGKVVLVDTFAKSENTSEIRERFVTQKEPVLCDGYVDCKVGKIVYDAKRYIPKINTEVFARFGGKSETVYLVDFVAVSADEQVFTFEFVV